MDFEALVNMLVAKFPVLGMVLLGLGVLVVLGQTYIAISPSKDDDAWYATLESKAVIGPILKFLASFAPLQRKEPKK